jgi:hypothetical protein
MTRCNTSSQMLLQSVQEWQLLWDGVVMCRCRGKRSALPHSRVMIHQPGGAQGVATDQLGEMLKLKDGCIIFLSTQDKHLIKCTKIVSVITG